MVVCADGFKQLTKLIVIAASVLSLGLPTSASASESAELESTKPALYIKFHPDFMVNLKADRPHFLMVTVQGMSRDAAGIEAVERHMAAIRHHVLMLLSEQTLDTIETTEDKKRLMDDALTRIQEVLVAETGQPGIEAVFFTDFVLE